MYNFINRFKAGHDLKKKTTAIWNRTGKRKGRKTGLTVIEAYPARAWPQRERNNMP